MPNWCAIIITIWGNPESMTKYYNDLTNDTFSFEATIPVGEEDWYNNHITFWGTKWDISEPETVKKTETEHVISGRTAWSPPEEWAENFSKKYKLNVKIAYVESGIGFYGIFEVGEGERVVKEFKFEIGDYTYDEETGQDIISGKLEKFMDENGLYDVGG